LNFFSETNNSLNIEGEKRLQLEAAIQAVQLLSTSSGEDVPVTQRAGVIFALAHLDLLDLALTLLNQMLSNNRIDAETAAWLFDKSIRSNNTAIQTNGSVLLNHHAEKLLGEKGSAAFPESWIHRWDTELPLNVRENICSALLKLIASRYYKDWNNGVLNALIATLVLIWRTEPETRINNGVAICLDSILKIYHPGLVLYARTGDIELDKIKAELSEFTKNEQSFVIDSDFALHATFFKSDWGNTNTSSI
jgi:hypothetical protein